MKYIKVIRKRKEQTYMLYAFFIGRNTILRQKESHPFHKFCSFLFLLHWRMWDNLGRIFFVFHNLLLPSRSLLWLSPPPNYKTQGW